MLGYTEPILWWITIGLASFAESAIIFPLILSLYQIYQVRWYPTSP